MAKVSPNKIPTLREEGRTRNEHTGDLMRTKASTNKFRDNFDKIKWGTKKAGETSHYG